MKRYRISNFDFDSRAISLEPIPEHWEESVRELRGVNQAQTLADLKADYGEADFETKLNNFKELGPKPLSVVAFHNNFLNQARHAFIHGQYYPSLTAVCALGERVLNHLVFNLRDCYKGSSLYMKVHRKKSFNNWSLMIDALVQWGVLTGKAETGFRSLAERRNFALHFNPEVEMKERWFAFEAIKNFEEIVTHQFAFFGNLPWLLPAQGEFYIRKEWEQSPFIRLVYIPNSHYVGYKHVVISVIPWTIRDAQDYPEEEVSDVEFVRLRQEFQASH